MYTVSQKKRGVELLTIFLAIC